MTKLEALENDVRTLSAGEFAQFRQWVLELDWERWDRQIEADSRAGKLREMADRARADHAAGRTKPI